MQNNFPGFGYQFFEPIVSKKNTVTDTIQKQVQSNFLTFDWEKFIRPKPHKEQLVEIDSQKSPSNTYYKFLAKLFDSL